MTGRPASIPLAGLASLGVLRRRIGNRYEIDESN
jgi:hypothetical protein